MPLLFARRGKAHREKWGVLALAVLLALPLFFDTQFKRVVSRHAPALWHKLNRNLQNAAIRNDVKQIRRLLDSGAAVDNWEPPIGQTPLFIAVNKHHIEAMRLFLNEGADPNALNGAISPFGLAINQWPDAKVLREFLKHGADPNTCATPSGGSVLWEAAFSNNKALLRELLRSGARADIKDKKGRTPLAEVICNGQMRSALLLLQKGALPEGKASLTGSIWVWLLSAHRKNSLYDSLPDCRPGCLHVEVARALLQNGADVQQRDASGSSLLHWATLTGDPAMVALMLQRGAPVNAADKHGYTALMAANGAIAPIILAHHPNLRLKNKSGETALDIARSGDDEKLQRVMEKAYAAKR